MTNAGLTDSFHKACEAWVCDNYFLNIRFIASLDERGSHIWDAAIFLNPLPAARDDSFRIESATFVVGQIQREGESKQSLLALLSAAASGVIELPDRKLILPSNGSYDLHTEMSQRDRWFSPLHLKLVGSTRDPESSTRLALVDTEFRTSIPPFDGVNDVARWLGLRVPGATPEPTSLSMHVSPPVDLILDQCSVTADQLRLTLHAHPELNVDRVGLAIRIGPDDGLKSRRQVASEVQWGTVLNGRREGVAQFEVKNADSVLTMLTLGESTVRRNWFLDSARARSNRLLAVRHFDKELRMVRQGVLESPDSGRFENGVAALLFLLGFTSSVQLETDSPDLIVTTPSGRLAIVECTMRVADIGAKIGKLVDRRGALMKALRDSGHLSEVLAVLVCRLPRDQIATNADQLRSQGVVLVAREGLEAGLERTRFPTDPDEIFNETQATISNSPKPSASESDSTAN